MMSTNDLSNYNNPDNTNELQISNIGMNHNMSSTDNDNNIDLFNRNPDSRIDQHVSRIEMSHNIVTKNDNDIDIEDNSVMNKDNLNLGDEKELHAIDIFHDIRTNIDNAIKINGSSVINEDNLHLNNNNEVQNSDTSIEISHRMNTNSDEPIDINNSSLINTNTFDLGNTNQLQISTNNTNINSTSFQEIKSISQSASESLGIANEDKQQEEEVINTPKIPFNNNIDVTNSSVVIKDNLDLGTLYKEDSNPHMNNLIGPAFVKAGANMSRDDRMNNCIDAPVVIPVILYKDDSNLPPGLQLTSNAGLQLLSNAVPNIVSSDDTFSKCEIDPFIDDTELRGSDFAMNVAASHSDHNHDESFHRDIEIENNDENNGKDLHWNDNKDDALKDAYLAVFDTDKELPYLEKELSYPDKELSYPDKELAYPDKKFLYPECQNNEIDNLNKENAYIEVCLQEENEILNANNHFKSSGEEICTLNSPSDAFKGGNLGDNESIANTINDETLSGSKRYSDDIFKSKSKNGDGIIKGTSSSSKNMDDITLGMGTISP
eukprot:CAMPEP_0119051790 /NCGR_PEP_ID=MMETSP1177-20130426/73290_1 /TAXON_ID=2985 /ORGANISM="Ochromonas sp, Strain CCMP1899" /LENGTH=546 /DNA_ID=CAMNT_0007031113 /DNA_START=1 /DNA_END=1645 /DNA_ORIENTATION=-